jgi:hypothetical protein
MLMNTRRAALFAAVTTSCAAMIFAVAPAFAASLSAIDSLSYTSIIGTEVDSMTSAYDFTADGVDGTITSTVYQGTGTASGYFVYTYQITLDDASASSVDSVSFNFSSTPTVVAGIGDAFYVDDGSGNVAPTSADYIESSLTVAFEFDLSIAAGDTSLEFGLFSAIAPDSTTAILSASTSSQPRRGTRRGAGPGVARLSSGTASVLSNGVAPVPEPTSALVFAIGFATIAARCRAKATRA